jgi:hypothetical protein
MKMASALMAALDILQSSLETLRRETALMLSIQTEVSWLALTVETPRFHLLLKWEAIKVGLVQESTAR